MTAYLARRVAYGFVTVLGVLFLLFVLFFAVTDPDDIARKAVGERARPEVYAQWKRNHGYDKPLFLDTSYPAGDSRRYTRTLLSEHYRSMLSFDFGRSDADDSPISRRLWEGAGPSLSLTLPLFALGLVFGVAVALFVAFFRETYIDRAVLVLCMLTMSVAGLLYIIAGQYLVGMLLKWFPISGFDWGVVGRFLALPVLVGVLSGFGADVRLYRTIFLEEMNRDYVRTARAKGCGDARVMMRHVLRNALIPILTNVVVTIPFLFTGALLLESFFGIPGLGSLTVEAIQGNDFATLRTMVYLGALLFILGQILTDLSYALADPRVRLN